MPDIIQNPALRFCGDASTTVHLMSVAEMDKWVRDHDYQPITICDTIFRPQWASVMVYPPQMLCPICRALQDLFGHAMVRES